MPRFLIPPEAIQGQHFILAGSEAHHAMHVLRKKPGDSIDLFDGKDRSYVGQITSVTTTEIHGTLIGESSGISLPVSIVLCQALIKGPKWDWLIEKAAEVGVSRLIPFTSTRTVVRLSGDDTHGKEERWNRIALAASKQCGRGDVMKIDAPLPIANLWSSIPSGASALIPWEKQDTGSVAQALSGQSAKEIWIFVGPEGGWDSAEVSAAQTAGVVPVRLGPTLLRSETAGLVAATLALAARNVY